MKKIAIMTCDKLKDKCSGTHCFEAFHSRSKAFEIYRDKEAQICAFFSCNGCGEKLTESMDYILNQLLLKEVDTIHMALCIDVECYRHSEIENVLLEKGFNVVLGSH
ncbi:CGGC domain-containing protein [Fusibacter sp. JL216-2]|uniref:CGGC domain-containing protein n=1 Tax=Fusibacter sp. JL216-2 TaxID=3071453 RepID=UPI003D350F11